MQRIIVFSLTRSACQCLENKNSRKLIKALAQLKRETLKATYLIEKSTKISVNLTNF